MKVHRNVLESDLEKCVKKRWYLGLDVEFRRVLKLLKLDGALPGQYPMRGFSGTYAGKILHARVNLPNMNYGKREGPRVAYFCPDNKPENILVVYVGGHKDRVYESVKFIRIVLERLSDKEDMFITIEEYLADSLNEK